jgi:hypothetical protein
VNESHVLQMSNERYHFTNSMSTTRTHFVILQKIARLRRDLAQHDP